MEDDFDALLGASDEPEGDIDGEFEELTFDKSDFATGGKKAGDSMSAANAKKVQRGVTVSWLVSVFGVPRTSVLRKIEQNNIPPKFTAQNNSKYYDVREIAPHLVKIPNIEEHIRSMSFKEMPHQLQKAYWSGQREKQRFLEDEGDLWRSERVINLFGDLFRMIKSQTRQWQTKMERSKVMTSEQIEALRDLSDELTNSVYSIVEALEAGDSAEIDEDENSED